MDDMVDESLHTTQPEYISDQDFQRACDDALKEHRAAGLPDSDVIKNFGFGHPTFERWATGTHPHTTPQQTRKEVIEEIGKWRRKQKGRQD